MNPYLDVRPEVAKALAGGKPVVALESTVIAHGLPRPQNFETALEMEAAIREQGAVPATVGLIKGRLVAGLSREEIQVLANSDGVAKVSRRDLAAVVVEGGFGATTVAGTMLVAAAAGIRFFATGGIGGVHRDVSASLDISNDLAELSRTPVAVICAGAKVILDLPKTLEALETLGVPVAGFGTDEFPAFYCRESGLKVDTRVDTAEEAARLLEIHWGLGMNSGAVIANPPPADAALSRAEVEGLLARALESAATQGIQGKAVTPYLLSQMAKESGGKTLRTNIALLIHNARLAAQIASAFSGRKPPRHAKRGVRKKTRPLRS
ncbi:MAG TPA: pseudouridine-5'-phosphate glycosidase [Verrucomicrobiae bacterium]|nr:pseudouridine-5'-phosphate glycosidase [Verrucomicrobiae bacterium]